MKQSPMTSEPTSIPSSVGEAVLRLLTQAEGRGGLLPAGGLLHWAYPETLAIVEYLADNIAAARVLFVFTLPEKSHRRP